ncbi:MAG TPA: radical SAM protein [Casimicrobiaceae bacterium]|nr:radical SAM protein [Casimicrobiaceae bacterium]
MRLLLINPKYPESFWSFRWAIENVLPHRRAVNPPLGLATLAALTPASWDIEIVDENVESLPLAPQADVVGICGMGVQFERQATLLEYYRERGYYVVAGGSFASLCPERYAQLADTVVAGEAEYQWPQFCADFERGCAAGLYQERGVVALDDSPTPRFDLLKLERYTTATLQFSRGCPFRCEFCDIIVMFGRKPRAKSVEQVERELDALRALRVVNVFFVDDNLIGNPRIAKALLRALIDYQRRHRYAFHFGTEVSINLAEDAELLQLMRDAGFGWVFIGIESPDPETLTAARKTQNTRQDVLSSVRTIYAHGIDVLAGLIVGFDNDTPRSFEAQHHFVMRSGIQAAMIGLLTALPRTPLYERLQREGRLLEDAHATDNTRLSTNVLPRHMSYDEMIEAYRRLYRRLVRDGAIAQRVRTKMRCVRDPIYRGGYAAGERVTIVWRLVCNGILPGGPRRAWLFVASLPWLAPSKIPLAIVDWIAGLSMQDYVRRHFDAHRPRERRVLNRRVAALRSALALQLRAGWLACTAQASQVQLSLRFEHVAGRRFFARLARRLDSLLRCRGASVTLRIERLLPRDAKRLERALERLARHGDRLHIVLSEPLRALLFIDTSRFDVVVSRAT